MFKVKVLREKTTVAIYARHSFFLELFLYHFLMNRQVEVYLIHPEPKELFKLPEWSFFTSHPKLKILPPQEAKTINNAVVDTFFDLAPLSWFEHLGQSLNEEVEVGFGFLNRLSWAVKYQSRYILLTPLIYNLSTEANLYYQLKNQQIFLNRYAGEYQLDYRIIQLPNYLYPQLFNQPIQNLLSLIIRQYLHQKPVFLSGEDKLYLADVESLIKVIERYAWGFSVDKEVSIINNPLPVKILFDKLQPLFGNKTINFQKETASLRPLLLAQTSYQNISLDKDLLKLSSLIKEGRVKLMGPVPKAQPQLFAPIDQLETVRETKMPPPHPVPPKKKKTELSLPHLSFNFQHPPYFLKQIKLFLGGLFLVLVGISLSLGVLVFSLKKGVSELATCLQQPTNTSCLEETRTNLRRAEKINSSLVPLFQLLGLATTNDRISDIVEFYQVVLKAKEEKNSLPSEETMFLDYLFNRGSSEDNFLSAYHRLDKRYHSLASNLDKALAIYQANQKTYDQIKLWQLNKEFRSTFERIENWRKRLKEGLVFWQKLPLLVGADKRKDYLIVFVDNNELRPGGGLITAYTQLSFEDGQLLDSQTFNIYQLDNQITGEITPPAPLREYLGQKSWHLRDAAWQPSFPDTARQIDWFYQKATGQSIDGIILVDDNFMAQMATLWSGLTLNDLKITLNKDNLRRRLFLWGNLEKGNQNQIFVSLLKTYISQLKQLRGDQLHSFLELVLQLAQGKDVAFYFNEDQLEDFFLQYGLGGEIKTPQCTANCLVAAGPVVEANLGANRVNYLLNQQLTTQLIFSPTTITEVLNLTISNQASSHRWPGGDYSDYLQWYVDKKWRLEEVRVGSNLLDLNKVQVATQSSFHIYSFFHQVGYNQSQTVSLKFQRPAIKTDSLDILFWQPKEIGLDIKKVLYQITPPRGRKIKLISPVKWLKSGQQIIYQQSLEKDVLIPVRLRFKK